MAVCCSAGAGGETSSKVPVLLKDHKVRGDVRRDPAHELQQAHVRVCPLLANPKIMSCASCFRAFLRILLPAPAGEQGRKSDAAQGAQPVIAALQPSDMTSEGTASGE